MFKTRFFILSLMLLLGFFSSISFAQTKTPSKAEIKKMAQKAVAYLNEANFEKSIAISREALHYAAVLGDDYLIAVSYNIIGATLTSCPNLIKPFFITTKAWLTPTKPTIIPLKIT